MSEMTAEERLEAACEAWVRLRFRNNGTSGWPDWMPEEAKPLVAALGDALGIVMLAATSDASGDNARG